MAIPLNILNKLHPVTRKRYLEKHADRKVHIISNHGIWRKGAMGYTNNFAEAGVYTLEEAYDYSGHCGPEKRVVYTDVSPMHLVINTTYVGNPPLTC